MKNKVLRQAWFWGFLWSLSASAGFAADFAPSADQPRAGRLWQLAADLHATLTAEQKAQFFRRAERMEQAHKMRMRARIRPQGKRGLAQRQIPLAGLRDLLSPEQMQTLREKQREQNPRRAEMELAMQTALKLSSNQVQQLQAVKANTREKMQALQARAKSEGRKEMREAFKNLREAATAERNKILTQDQQEIIRIHRALVLGAMKRAANRPARMQGQHAPKTKRMPRTHAPKSFGRF